MHLYNAPLTDMHLVAIQKDHTKKLNNLINFVTNTEQVQSDGFSLYEELGYTSL